MSHRQAEKFPLMARSSPRHYFNGMKEKDISRLVRFLIDSADTLNGYTRLKVYYDNGQPQIKEMLKEAFAIYASKTEFVSDVHPDKYRLFQVADTLCTLELTRLKLLSGDRLSSSEFEFFGGIQNLKRHYFKPIEHKRVIHS